LLQTLSPSNGFYRCPASSPRKWPPTTGRPYRRDLGHTPRVTMAAGTAELIEHYKAENPF
jgi:hypothetical protein